MNSTILFAVVAAAAVFCGVFGRRTVESKRVRASVDVVLVAAALGGWRCF
jgi:hypothetical protein